MGLTGHQIRAWLLLGDGRFHGASDGPYLPLILDVPMAGNAKEKSAPRGARTEGNGVEKNIHIRVS